MQTHTLEHSAHYYYVRSQLWHLHKVLTFDRRNPIMDYCKLENIHDDIISLT